MLLHKLEKALSFSASDWLAFFQAWFILLFVDLGFRCLGFNRINRIVNGNAVDPVKFKRNISILPYDGPVNRKAKIERSLSIVDTAIRNHLYPMTCLRRALAIQWMLKRQGFITNMKFGVNLFDGKLQAHAWLEHDGLAISDPETVVERFTPLEGSPAPDIRTS